MKINMTKKQIREIEIRANAVLRAGGQKPVGSDRAPYKTVAYSAQGSFECETVQGCRDYLTASDLAKW